MRTSFSQRAKQLRRKSFLNFERLEDRSLMAGNVTAIDAGGYLMLFGDNADNQVAITQNANGSLQIAGVVGSNTTINGQATATVGAPTRGALVLMGNGNDTVSITGTAAAPINFGATTSIDLGNGDDTLNLSNFRTAGSLTVFGGLGNDTINAARAVNATTGFGVQVGGSLVVNTLLGDDTVNLRNSSVNLVTVVDLNAGQDTLDIRNSQFGHVALFIGGSGIDTLNNAGNTFAFGSFNPIKILFENQTAINAPIAVNDTATATVGSTATISVLGNDNANGGTLNTGSVVIVTQPTNGTAVANANGTISYTPFPNTTATTDVFTYTVADTNGNVSNAGTVNVSINNPPTIATIANQVTNEDTPITVPITVGDIQTPVGSLIVSAVSSVPGLVTSIVPNAGNTQLVITPALNANTQVSGPATITVTVQDAAGAQTQTTFTLTVNPVNDAPTLTQPLNIQSAPGQVITTTTTAADIDTPLANVTVTGTSNNQLLIPDAGISVTGSGATRTITLTPLPGATGTATIQLTATDGSGGTSIQTFVVNISTPPTVAVAQVTGGATVTGGTAGTGQGATATLAEDTSANVGLTIATPEAGETMQSVVITSSNQSIVTNASLAAGYNAGTNTLTITPVANANGTATITVVATDSLGFSTTRTFTVNVTPVDDATVNADQTISGLLVTSAPVVGDVTAPVTVGANANAATDIDGPLTVTGVKATSGGSVTAPGTSVTNEFGTLTMNANGTYTFTIDPNNLAGFGALPSGFNITIPVQFFFDLSDGTTTTEGSLTFDVTKP